MSFLPVPVVKSGLDIASAVVSGAASQVISGFDQRQTLRVQMECAREMAKLKIAGMAVECLVSCVQGFQDRAGAKVQDRICRHRHLECMEKAEKIFAYREQFTDSMSEKMRDLCDETFFAQFR
ncbi:MAG: hypothetical protein R2941_16205 [Desulfobacterales bacterium]